MFGERVKELRKKANLSQEELGVQFSISGPSISKWEAGLTEPDNETLIKLSKFFNVSIDYLLGNEKHAQTIDDNQKTQVTLRQVLQKIGYTDNGENLTNEELERVVDFVRTNKKFLKDNK